MAETEGQAPAPGNDHDKTVELKKAAYYAATYDAFMATTIEADKSILTVSAGGVGLLVTLLALYQVKTTWDIIVYLIALVFFVISIVASIFIFKRNHVVLMSMLMDRDQKDPILTVLDYLNMTCCILGILLTIYIGLSTGIQKLNAKAAPEEEKAAKTVQINTVNGNVILQGYTNMSSIKGGKKNGK
jgi:hypothetical protein